MDMTDPISFDEAKPTGRARKALLRRLVDYVAMPASGVAPQDRALGGDILLDMLFHATDSERKLCAERLAQMREAPRRVLRYLAQCSFDVAEPLLAQNEAFDASDLGQLINRVSAQHRVVIAGRKSVPPAVGDQLVEHKEQPVIDRLLKNRGAELSEYSLDLIVAMSRKNPQSCGLILERPELRPAQAMAMFWWADSQGRRAILQRFAADRNDMIKLCSDIFTLAADEDWQDPVVRKTLQLIERRQRNRAAIEKSPFESLEQAIGDSATAGLEPSASAEIGYLAGIKPITIAKIFTDPGGEGLSVLCKATGLKRDSLLRLWQGLGRQAKQDDGTPHPAYKRIEDTFDVLSVAKAQTTLRYWNWSLSSAYSPARSAGADFDDEAANDDVTFSTPRRTAKLVFGK